jgi:hypothetical protein
MTLVGSQRALRKIQTEKRALTRILWGKTDSIEWPGLASGLREGEYRPGAVAVIIR